jgi:hypothetical protein
LQALEDSINNNFWLAGTDSPYTALIPARFLAGMEYRWKKKVTLGAVFEGEILSGRFHPGLSLTAIARPQEWLTASFSYSPMDRSFSNFGFGLVLGNGPVQFYAATDNIPLRYVKESTTGIFWPYNAHTFNFRTGLNILIGCRDPNSSRMRGIRWRKSCPAYN